MGFPACFVQKGTPALSLSFTAPDFLGFRFCEELHSDLPPTPFPYCLSPYRTLEQESKGSQEKDALVVGGTFTQSPVELIFPSRFWEIKNVRRELVASLFHCTVGFLKNVFCCVTFIENFKN